MLLAGFHSQPAMARTRQPRVFACAHASQVISARSRLVWVTKKWTGLRLSGRARSVRPGNVRGLLARKRGRTYVVEAAGRAVRPPAEARETMSCSTAVSDGLV